MAARTREQILVEINAIRNETSPGANSRSRVSDCLQNISDSALLMTVARSVEEFGAVGDCTPNTTGDPTTGTDDTAAFQAALDWANAAGHYSRRVIELDAKTYWIRGHLNTPAVFTMRGKGKGRSRLWFEDASGGSYTDTYGIVLGGLESVVSSGVETEWGYGASHNTVIEHLSIHGPATCGTAAIHIPFAAYNLSIRKVAIFGAWARGVSCTRAAPGLDAWVTGYADRQGGAIIWGEMDFDEIAPGDMWATASNYYPTYLVYVRGFWSAGRLHADMWGHTAGLYVEKPLGVDDHNQGCVDSSLAITGSVQACTYGVRAINTGIFDYSGLYGELSAPARIVSIEGYTPNSGGRVVAIGGETIGTTRLRTTPNAVLTYRNVDWDHTCYAPVFISGFSPAGSRTVANEITLGLPYNAGLEGAYNPGGYGLVDPKNLLLNGDFSRWVGADGTEANLAGWTGSTSGHGYIATKCGVGCTDTTRTNRTQNCALIAPVGGDARIRMHGRITGPLDAKLLGCYATVSLKYRIASGDAEDLNLNVVAVSNTAGADQRGSQYLPMATFAAENGFTEWTATILITAAMVSSGLALQVWSQDSSGVTLYLSEAQCSIGYSCPRWFDRASEFAGALGHLRDDGTIVFPVSAVPVASTDPIFGQAWVDGDFARLIVPTTGATEGGIPYTMIGWIRVSSAWVPQYTVSSLASSGNHLLDPFVEAQSTSDTTLSSDSATVTLTKTLLGLANSAHYVGTVGLRVTLWQTSDVTVCGSIDETVDIAVATDGSGVATVTILGSQSPDTSRLPAGLAGATAALGTTTGGVTVTASRPAGLGCTARARLWAHRLERLS